MFHDYKHFYFFLSLFYSDTLDTMISLAVVDSGVTIASLELFIPFTDCDVHVR